MNFKQYISELKESFASDAIARHTAALNKAVRDKDDNEKNYHLAMLAKAEANRRRRDIQGFEEKRTRLKSK